MTSNPFNDELIKFLPGSSSEMWHQIAWNWNWDNGEDVLKWITLQKKCDKGTALLIYWYSGPRYFGQYENRENVPEFELASYDFMKDIQQKYLAGFYKTANFSFDPKNDSGLDRTKDYEENDKYGIVPEQMFQPVVGKTLEKIILEEGYPQEVLAKVDNS